MTFVSREVNYESYAKKFMSFLCNMFIQSGLMSANRSGKLDCCLKAMQECKGQAHYAGNVIIKQTAGKLQQ